MPETTEINPELMLLTSQQVADRLGKSLITLERWRRQGRGPRFIRTSGTRVGYPVKALEEWLATGSSS